MKRSRHKSVVVAGCGNIGSQLIPHVARMPGVGRVVLIDHDVYEAGNVGSQNIGTRDAGRQKVIVQAERVLAVNPSLVVEPLAQPLEEVPLGRLNADVVACCLDSRQARQYVNEAAVHLGVSWVDSGIAVLPDGSMLARTTLYPARPEAACMECSFDPRQRGDEGRYPCRAGTAESASTGAPVYLGALAASLQAFNCEAVLAGELPEQARQVLVDARHHSVHETTFLRNPDCLLGEHGHWAVDALGTTAGGITVAGLLERGGLGDGAWFGVEWGRFEIGARCSCGFTACEPRLRRLYPVDHGCCPECENPITAVGRNVVDDVPFDSLSDAVHGRRLRMLGIRAGDVLRITGENEVRRFQVDDEGGFNR